MYQYVRIFFTKNLKKSQGNFKREQKLYEQLVLIPENILQISGL